MNTHGSSHRFVKNSDSESPFPLENPLSHVVVASNSHDLKDLKIDKTTTTTRQQQQEEIIPCELSTDEWYCDFKNDEDLLSEPELFQHIRTPEHIRGMIELLEKFDVKGSATHKLPTTYPHQTDHTIIHIKHGMSDRNKESIRNWGGFIPWYIQNIATEVRPKFRAQTTPFQPKTTRRDKYSGNRW
tara:strand:+ start:1198 stop:1755 length:558 start_codon:yes stop_codon:yes gene_type:complete